jgi:hypothetical protein
MNNDISNISYGEVQSQEFKGGRNKDHFRVEILNLRLLYIRSKDPELHTQ